MTKLTETSAKSSKESASSKITTKISRPQLLGRTPLPKHGALTGWRLVDATGVALGRLSSRVAMVLMGKDKAFFTRFSDTGDHIIVVNAEKVLLTGKKWTEKIYYHHTNYPGGIKSCTAREIQQSKFPERIVKWAIYGMLPKGHMGRRWYKKLHVYAGPAHPHTAQKPTPMPLDQWGLNARG